MREIPLTHGRVALVSDGDYDSLVGYRWVFVVRKVTGGGYAGRYETVNGRFRQIYMHRQIMGNPSGVEIDHRNGNPLDNTRENLRHANRTENSRNCTKYAHGKSTYKGVACVPRKDGTPRWRAIFHLDRKQIHIGYFSIELEAARAWDRVAREYYGEFARLNFPDDIAA